MRWCDGRQSHACHRWPGENAGAHSYSTTRLAPCTTQRRRAAALAPRPRHATPSDTATTTSASSKHERNGGAEIFASRDDAGARARHIRRVVEPSPAAAQISAQRHHERSMFHAAPSRSAFFEQIDMRIVQRCERTPEETTCTSTPRIHRQIGQRPRAAGVAPCIGGAPSHQHTRPRADGLGRSGASARAQSRRHLLRHLRAVISFNI